MTATQLQFRRGTAAQMATFTGAQGEVVVDTTNNRVVVHDGTTAGGWPAARVAEVAPQSGRLSYVSATQIKFAPFNGGSVKIAGALYQIPSAGVTAANTSAYVNGTAGQNLAASTLYYVYLFNNAGTLTIDFSSTGHAADSTAGNVGVEIKSGDNSRTLIGMIYTNGSSQFSDTQQFRGVATWFNRRLRALVGASTSNAQTSSTSSWVELDSTKRAYFLAWADSDILTYVGGSASNTSASNTTLYDAAGIDGASAFAAEGSISPQSPNLGWGVPNVLAYAVSEGNHYMTPLGLVIGGTGSYYIAVGGLLFI
jgi:hypothetical protein